MVEWLARLPLDPDERGSNPGRRWWEFLGEGIPEVAAPSDESKNRGPV
jgi:hypothetical protein